MRACHIGRVRPWNLLPQHLRFSLNLEVFALNRSLRLFVFDQEDVAGGWEGMFSVIYSAEEDAVVVGGSTAGTEEGANAGNFSAIKFTSDEQEIWRWKVSAHIT